MARAIAAAGGNLGGRSPSSSINNSNNKLVVPEGLLEDGRSRTEEALASYSRPRPSASVPARYTIDSDDTQDSDAATLDLFQNVDSFGHKKTSSRCCPVRMYVMQQMNLNLRTLAIARRRRSA